MLSGDSAPGFVASSAQSLKMSGFKRRQRDHVLMFDSSALLSAF
jgi:hypothetical protein